MQSNLPEVDTEDQKPTVIRGVGWTMTIQVSACEGCNTRYLAKKSPFLSPTFLVEIEGRIC